MNETGIALIKKYEGLRLKAYKCPAGKWTIGWGSTGKDIIESLEWTIEKAETRLKFDIKEIEFGILRVVNVPINENQLSALVCFVYNIGLSAFYKSTLLKKLNHGDYQGAADEFLRWTRVKGEVVNGLVKRRNEERNLFLSR